VVSGDSGLSLHISFERALQRAKKKKLLSFFEIDEREARLSGVAGVAEG
jgi:hypothetical protein